MTQSDTIRSTINMTRGNGSLKPYLKPAAVKHTLEESKLKLLGYAVMGNQDAKDLLKILFDAFPKPASDQTTD